MSKPTIILRLTPYQAMIAWGALDGACDAGAGSGGNSDRETRALGRVAEMILDQREKWKDVRP